MGHRSLPVVLLQPKPELAAALPNVSNISLKRGKLEEAVALLRRAIAVPERTLGPAHSVVAFRLINLAGILTMRPKACSGKP